MKNTWKALIAVLLAWVSFGTAAQVPQYGVSINLEQAKKAIAAGQAEARKNNWPVAIAVVDNSGNAPVLRKLNGHPTF